MSKSKKQLDYLITVDGPAASGKSSLSRCLANKLGWKWLSTGVFYRGLAYLALNKEIKEEKQIVVLIKEEDWSVCLNEKQTSFIYRGEDITSKIYTETVDVFASQLAGFTLVRRVLLPYQRNCFEQSKQALVAEGRDCGTVVFPSARLKIYLTAPDGVRATRRANQRGSLAVDHVIHLQKQRDEQDIRRANSPLRRAEGSFIIDSGVCSFNGMVEEAYKKSCEIFCLE